MNVKIEAGAVAIVEEYYTDRYGDAELDIAVRTYEAWIGSARIPCISYEEADARIWARQRGVDHPPLFYCAHDQLGVT